MQHGYINKQYLFLKERLRTVVFPHLADLMEGVLLTTKGRSYREIVRGRESKGETGRDSLGETRNRRDDEG